MANTAAKRVTGQGRGKTRGRAFWRKYGKHYLGLAPFVVFFGVFILWPMLYGLVMSFLIGLPEQMRKFLLSDLRTLKPCSAKERSRENAF